ncbi:MAG: S8 family serine peptidase [Phycisphaerae bacterium]|nr:S8 family serine peptidase [Gemmatimonadaceae bacterium]
MKQFPLVSLPLLLLFSACAGAAPISTAPTAGRPAPGSTTNANPLAPPVLKDLASAPDDWHRMSADKDGVFGVGSDRAIAELLQGRSPARRVIVAVIDGGVDTAHTALKGTMWRNAKETNNGKDDDGNGLVDDAFGWNYAGGANGKSVNDETLEVTRLYAACRDMAAGKGTQKPDAATCNSIKTKFDEKRAELTGQLGQIETLTQSLAAVTGILQRGIGSGPLTRPRVEAYRADNPQAAQAREFWLQIEAAGLVGEGLEDAKKQIGGQVKVGLDLNYDSRTIVGDNILDYSERVYGNRDVTGPDASHGTHVAGIIAAARGIGKVEGIAPMVQIMALRAVPNGDERDKDIANAIRYAADNGANIINMSFGKSYSPGKSAVDAAAKYAVSKGVLLVHAAGNDGEDIDVLPSFPSPIFEDKTRSPSWIEVGASSWKGFDELSASFSNYGKTRVDLFAPGVDILSTVPGGGTKRESSTSMAAPVVSGVAALLMSYFPTLTAADIKDILVQSARRVSATVAKPGGGGKAPFTSLSQTGAIVDAYAAVKLAQTRAAVMKH